MLWIVNSVTLPRESREKHTFEKCLLEHQLRPTYNSKNIYLKNKLLKIWRMESDPSHCTTAICALSWNRRAKIVSKPYVDPINILYLQKK